MLGLTDAFAALAASTAFAALLAAQLVPRLFASAKKLRNQALPAVLTAICVGVAALARVLAGLALFDTKVLLVIASAAWSSAFALLLVLLVRLRAT